METEKMPSSEALDSRWYKRFSDCAFEDYEKLSGNKTEREKQKAMFLNNESKNPIFDYPELETFDIEGRDKELVLLKEDILELEPNELVKKIYRTKINESLATLRMLKATKDGDDRKFSKYADFIYGKPQQGEVGYVFKSIKEEITKHLDSDDPVLREAAQKLDGLLSDVNLEADDGASSDILPSGQIIEGRLENADEAVAAFQDALAELNIDDWAVVVDSEKGISNFSVSQEDKIVRIPSDEQLKKRNISIKKMRGLIAHEIGTHVLRRHNVERSKLQLLGLGLDRYLKGEEGIATYAEQQVTGASEFAGIARMFSVAIAKGVDGEPRDFRDTFEIMRDYRLLSQKESENSQQKASDTAYNDCVRIFRGSTGSTPGAIYPKDMAYFGNRSIWTLVSKDSDAVLNFSVGKYDPTNPEHVAVLTQLGILDDDLLKLDS